MERSPLPKFCVFVEKLPAAEKMTQNVEHMYHQTQLLRYVSHEIKKKSMQFHAWKETWEFHDLLVKKSGDQLHLKCHCLSLTHCLKSWFLIGPSGYLISLLFFYNVKEVAFPVFITHSVLLWLTIKSLCTQKHPRKYISNTGEPSLSSVNPPPAQSLLDPLFFLFPYTLFFHSRLPFDPSPQLLQLFSTICRLLKRIPT